MLIKIFTLKFSEVLEGFDDQELRGFLAGKQIISVCERFFIKDNVPYWTIMLRYKSDADIAYSEGKEEQRDARKDEYRSLLDENSMPIFNLLRDWRNKQAKDEGVPPYILFTNRQIAEIASKSPENLNQLAAIEGVGKNKLEKYGKEVLAVGSLKKQEGPEDKTKKDSAHAPEKAKTGQGAPQMNDTPLWDSDEKKKPEASREP